MFAGGEVADVVFVGSGFGAGEGEGSGYHQIKISKSCFYDYSIIKYKILLNTHEQHQTGTERAKA